MGYFMHVSRAPHPHPGTIFDYTIPLEKIKNKKKRIKSQHSLPALSGCPPDFVSDQKKTKEG
jgi:hypothetical protein